MSEAGRSFRAWASTALAGGVVAGAALLAPPSLGAGALVDVGSQPVLRWVGEPGRPIPGSSRKGEPVALMTSHLPGITGGDGTVLSFYVQHETNALRAEGRERPVPEVLGTHHWLEEGTAPGVTGGQLLSAEPEGLRLHLLADGGKVFHFRPGLLEFPADPKVGQTFTSEGVVNRVPVTPYRAEGVIEDAAATGPGCLRATITVTAGTQPVPQRSFTRCPGRGLVAWSSEHGSFEAQRAYPADAHPAAKLDLTAPTLGRDLQAGQSRLIALKTMFTPSLALPPVSAGEGFVVANAESGGVHGLVADGDNDDVAWAVFPGGDVVALGASGELVVAGTSRRELQGYSAEDGQWLWSASLTENAAAQPRVVGDLVVVPLADASLVAVEARTGVERWQVHDIAADVPVAATERGIVVTGDRQVALLDVDGSVTWRAPLERTPVAVTTSGETVVVADGARVWALDLATGRPAWEAPSDSFILAGVEGTLVAVGYSGIVGFDAATGRERWREAGAVTSAVGDAGGVLVRTQTATLEVGADGVRQSLPADAKGGRLLGRWGAGAVSVGEWGQVSSWRPR